MVAVPFKIRFVFDLPILIVVAFVVPMFRVVTLLSIVSNFAVEEFNTETFVVPSNLVEEVAVPRLIDPVVRLLPMFIVEVAVVACKVFELKLLIVVAPSKVVEEVADPKLIIPVVKLFPMFIVEVTELAFMVLTVAVEIFKDETFAEEKVCTPDQVFDSVVV